MSKATQRREKKLAQELRNQAASDPARFMREWETMLHAWAIEAMKRGRMLQREPGSGSTCPDNQPVFGVLKKAERLLALCGHEVEQLVGARTRDLLSNDCAKAVAIAVDQNMYRLCVNLQRPKSRKPLSE